MDSVGVRYPKALPDWPYFYTTVPDPEGRRASRDAQGSTIR